MSSSYLTPVAYSVPFDNSTDGFVSNNTQAAIEEALAAAGGLQPYYAGTGLIVNYKAGRAWINGSAFILTAGTITVGASLTNNFIYLSLAGTVVSGASVPSNAVPIAQFTSSPTAVTSLTDIRGSLNNNVQFGLVADITTEVVATTSVAGATNRFADAGHQHAMQLTAGEVSATATITAGTAADTLMTGMTVTPAAGTYMVWFSCDVNAAASGQAISGSIYVGGTQKADSLRKIVPGDGGLGAGAARAMLSTNGLVTVNGSQAIEIRWSASAGTNTAAARTMNWIRTL